MSEPFKNKFNYKTLEIADSLKQELLPYVEECYDFIENGKVVYVHCAAGVSRSASVVVSYVMKKYQWSFVKAY